jgi:hypothetical protein
MAKYEGAQQIFVKARYHYVVSSQNLDVAKLDYSIARVLINVARYKEAEEMLKKALENYGREKGEDDIDCANVINRLGSLYVTMSRYVPILCFAKVLVSRNGLFLSSFNRFIFRETITYCYIEFQKQKNVFLKHFVSEKKS